MCFQISVGELACDTLKVGVRKGFLHAHMWYARSVDAVLARMMFASHIEFVLGIVIAKDNACLQ